MSEKLNQTVYSSIVPQVEECLMYSNAYTFDIASHAKKNHIYLQHIFIQCKMQNMMVSSLQMA